MPPWLAASPCAAASHQSCESPVASSSSYSLPIQSRAASPALAPLARLQHKGEAELRGHSEGVTNLAWHPTHPDKLASIAGPEKSVR